ncbi:conserved hypothetical protein [Hyella patelloides LEGE 07179]|uniref:Uncharacterized protein n=1 Tax=Hyella patelloides LEGE 07179 TaxID=945734 RepID=A0A563VMM3_9CYAN|nr:hypothetical protein [Hyella patelloides]VEP12535.1 conserved hypothetical protein [Hyella patelloides LEGE 07179]
MVIFSVTIARMFKQLKNWLANQRSFLFSWYTKDSQETQEPERSLTELPPETKKQLVDLVQNLPNNPIEQEAISVKLDEAWKRWREDPNNANNSVVILSSPITAVSIIISETMKKWSQQKQIDIKLLPLTARPTEITDIKAKLEHFLKYKSEKENHDEKSVEVMVIPNLGWCFLRSLNGLEGIEYLQSLLCQHFQHRFWVIGAGQVGWEYLDLVCNLSAYCGETFVLPEVSPENLQTWLNPIVEQLSVTFDRPRIDQQLLKNDKDDQTRYFESLANVAEGVSTIAVQVFLKSIYQQVENDDQNEEEQAKSKPNPLAKTPQLPNLPSIDSIDRYILYSLLLHNDLTMSALAESLGDGEGEVQGRVQVLRRKGIIEQQNKILKINPIHYPKLKQELDSNNFIISGN